MFPWHCELSKHFPFSQQCNTHNIYSPILALSCSCKTCALCVLWIIYDHLYKRTYIYINVCIYIQFYVFINCDRQAVLCLMFVFCSVIVSFPLYRNFFPYSYCTLFFSVFVNFIFSNFKMILLCLHVIPLFSFNNSFIVNL